MARAVICTPVPLTSYTSQPTASSAAALAGRPTGPRPRRGGPGSAPGAGGAPPRTATPAWPAATTSHSSNTPPPPSSTAMPTPAGLSTVQRRTVGRAPPRTSMPAAERVTIRRSQQLRGALLDEQCGRGRVLALDMQVLDRGGGAHGQRHPVDRRDPHGPGRALGAAQRHRALHDEVLPVGARRDGEHVTVARGLQSGGERCVLTSAAPPPRRAGVRHLDRALCHGAVVPPPRRTRVLRGLPKPVGMTESLSRRCRRPRPVHRSVRGGRPS